MSIQWFPGHMAKAKRMIAENLPLIDVVLETVDARAPLSSSNNDLKSILDKKMLLKILTKNDLANPEITKEWLKYHKAQGIAALAVDSLHKQGLEDIKQKLKEQQGIITEALAKKGRRPRPIRVLVAGIPNVGKSSLINALVKKEVAKTADIPGYTKGKQWVRVAQDIELMDTPGIMPPKFDSERAGKILAALGTIKSEVFSEEDVAQWLLEELRPLISDVLQARYGIEPSAAANYLEIIGEKIGAINKGGAVDSLKAARYVLKEFQSGKFGRISLETPPKNEGNF